MTLGRLTELQAGVLTALAEGDLGWTLTGGGALVATHAVERTTRDLDLFFHGRSELGDTARVVEDRLVAAGIEVDVLQRASAFCRIRASRGGESVIVDLVAEPVERVAPAVAVELEGVTIEVDSPHEILVNKLCALLSRSEVRDLGDVRSLLEAGGDLERALVDAPRKDGSFSPLTLAWVLETFSLPSLAARDGYSQVEIEPLEEFRKELVSRLTELAIPE